MNVRIIPRLDIKGPNVVKGIHLEGLRVLGKPEEYSKFYYESGADELLFMDVVASLYGRNSLLSIVEKTAQEIFVPLIVGGGIRTIQDINDILRVGADKVCINTAAIKNPRFIQEAANKFGSSTIVVSIEAIKKGTSGYEAYTHCGRESTQRDAIQWAQEAEDLGAGEILITSIDKEGTGSGFEIELLKRLTQSIRIPVIACGGAGKMEHAVEVIQKAHVDAVGMASLFHYDYVAHHRPKPNSIADAGNMEFLHKGGAFSKIHSSSIGELKAHLNKEGIPCRLES